MAVSRRLRFEILRRDDYRCHYCGASAPDVALTVDHVVPVALGGSDDPSNLVAACADCNAGKTSTSPDAPLVEQVNEDAARWARAMAVAAEVQLCADEQRRTYAEVFEEQWNAWAYPDGAHVAKPNDWRVSVNRWHDAGLNFTTLRYLIDDVLSRNVPDSRMWRYFCGAVWNKLREQQAIARDMLVAGEEDHDEPWENLF